MTPPREGGYQRRLRRDSLIGLISTRPGPDTAASEPRKHQPTPSPTSLDSSAEREFITVVLEQVHEERDWKVTIDPVRGVTEPMARYVAPESILISPDAGQVLEGVTLTHLYDEARATEALRPHIAALCEAKSQYDHDVYHTLRGVRFCILSMPS